MFSSILDIVRSSTSNTKDSLALYHGTDRISNYYGLTIDDLRCTILDQFVNTAKNKNGVTPNTRLCLVFDSAGSAIFEKMFVLVAIHVLNVSDIHVIFSDIEYKHSDNLPNVQDLPVTVELVNNDRELLEALKRVREEGYEIMLNALFIQRISSSLISEKSNKQARIEYMKLCMPYGIYFSNRDYDMRDSLEYLLTDPIIKYFKEYNWLEQIDCAGRVYSSI